MKEYVRKLYGKSWNEYKIKVHEVVNNKSLAKELIEAFIKDKGWRERVSAAKLIATFSLINYIPDLLKTFERAPEYYTCCAFSIMIKEIYGNSGVEYLQEMRSFCETDGRGQVMINVIDKIINECKNA